MERDSQKHTVQWHLVVGNMRTSDGSWELRPVGEDSAQTLTIYTVSSDPGIPVPAPLIKVALDNTLPDVIHGLRKRVKKLSAKE
jgi:hypothetical protein